MRLRSGVDGASAAFRSRLAHVACAALACACVAASAADTVPARLSQRLLAIAGADSDDCGAVPLGADAHAALTCAQRSDAAGRAFRVIVQEKGADAPLWLGAARDARGQRWMVVLDAEASAGGGTAPTLSAVPCSAFVFALDGKDALECNPSFGEP